MFTLKIHVLTCEREGEDAPDAITDSCDQFIQADEVRARGQYPIDDTSIPDGFAAWVESDLEVERDILHWTDDSKIGGTRWGACRLLEVRHAGTTRWILASNAWLLGPDGKTIERLT